MTAPVVRVYINERGVTVPSGASVVDAVHALFPDDADALRSGQARLTDSRGLPVSADEPLVNGAIYRVLPTRDRLSSDVT
jgi:hypothetical protein